MLLHGDQYTEEYIHSSELHIATLAICQQALKQAWNQLEWLENVQKFGGDDFYMPPGRCSILLHFMQKLHELCAWALLRTGLLANIVSITYCSSR